MHRLITENLPQIKAICKKNSISYLGLFGSYARGDETKESDVDLLVTFTKVHSLFDLVEIKHEFEELLQRDVDLVQKDAIKKNRKKYILPMVEKIYEL